MGTFSRLRYVVAANVNALIEKAEDPEKLLRALIREMEDASEEARLAGAELLAEQQRLERLQTQLGDEAAQWRSRAETAVEQGRDDLARAALQARSEAVARLDAAADEAQRVAARVAQLEQDMTTLKNKMADAKTRLKSMQTGRPGAQTATGGERLAPGERKLRRSLERFDRLQAQVDNLEARVRSYDVGGPAPAVWTAAAAETADPAIEAELAALKQRLAPQAVDHPQAAPQPVTGEEAASA
jgi:phage shock protein A